MKIEVDTRSPVPHYEQIRSQITRLVLAGALPPGTRLPTIRRLAGDLGLAVNTVARAYRELELNGIVSTSGKRGTSIAEQPRDPADFPDTEERRHALSQAAAEFGAVAHSLGYTLPEAQSALVATMRPAGS